jgi:prepilin-type processing-associated H-X9-DG protein
MIYNSAHDHFAQWIASNRSYCYYDSHQHAYHYKLQDGADNYAYLQLPVTGSFRLEFEVLPTRTDWGGNLRIGLWNQLIRYDKPSNIQVHFNVDANGSHIHLQHLGEGSSSAVDTGPFVDGNWYRISLEYSAEQHIANLTVKNLASDETVTGYVSDVQGLIELSRIALSSVGDYSYPGKSAEGYIRNLQLILLENESSRMFPVDQYGYLQLSMNDSCGDFRDNEGALNVRLEVQRGTTVTSQTYSVAATSAWPLQTDLWLDTRGAPRARLRRFSHNDGMNISFADGHAAWFSRTRAAALKW